MELLQLTYFCDAAETEKFTETARRFRVPVSNISQSVKRLERELGTELFEHHKNRVRLSDSGRAFYGRARAALRLLETGREEIRDAQERIAGDIRLLVLCNRRYVTSVIERFKASYPEVNFLLRHDRAEEGACDLVVSDILPAGYDAAARLVREEILLALPDTHPLAKAARIEAKELSDERFITMPRGRSLYRFTEALASDGGFSPNITIETDDPYYVRKYVALGLGVAMVPAFSWQGLFPENMALRRVGNYTRETFIGLPHVRTPRRAVREFLRALTGEVLVEKG